MFKILKKIFFALHKGSSEGIVITSIISLIALGFFIKTGLGIFIDSFVVIFLTLIIFLILKRIVSFLSIISRSIPVEFICSILAVIFFMIIIPYSELSEIFIFIEIVIGVIIGLAIYNGPKKLSSIIIVLSALGINIFIVLYCLDFLNSSKSDILKKNDYTQISQNLIPDPSEEGDYNVKTLFYGSGWDKQRPEYGISASIKTQTFDVTPFFPETSGFQNKMRKWFWGFDATSFPINGRVWYPSGKDHCPLVLIVHGNYQMENSSDAGYEYLGRLLAGRGFIVASIDENFLNEGWSGDYDQKENYTRAWIILKHLEYWKKWNETNGNYFYKKVDMNKIALIGHSRGGTATLLAASKNIIRKDESDSGNGNFNFSIKSIVQIAPEDFYHPDGEDRGNLSNINYLVIRGGYGDEVNYYIDNGFYDNINYTGNDFYFKTALYIHDADKIHFNTVWEKNELGHPGRWALGIKRRIDGEKQRKIAAIYISAFLEATLNSKKEFIPVFKDYKSIKKILPDDEYITQYEDSKSEYLFDAFERNPEPGTQKTKNRIESENLKVWSPEVLIFHTGSDIDKNNCISYIKWNIKNDLNNNSIPKYSIILSDSVVKQVLRRERTSLFFFICSNMNNPQNSIDFSIELRNKSGNSVEVPLSQFEDLNSSSIQPFSEGDESSGLGSSKSAERILRYVEIPLGEISIKNNNFDPSQLTEIRFLFDRTPEGEIILGKMGFN